MGSSPTLAAKPKCALRLVECGVKCIGEIEVICLSFQVLFADEIKWRQSSTIFFLKNEFNLVGEIKFRYLLLDTVNLNGGN